MVAPIAPALALKTTLAAAIGFKTTLAAAIATANTFTMFVAPGRCDLGHDRRGGGEQQGRKDQCAHDDLARTARPAGRMTRNRIAGMNDR